MTRFFPRAQAALLLISATVFVAPPAARADEFSPVAANDSAYAQLNILAPTGWIESRPGARAVLTRYEIATETARAILAFEAQQNESKKTRVVPRSVVRALRELTVKFRPELRSLGIDAAAALRRCDALLQAEATTLQATPTEKVTPEKVTPETRVENARPGFARPLRTVPPSSPVAISNRLRLDSMVSALSRDALDPFGDTDDIASRESKLSRADVALGLSDWLSVRASGGSFRSDTRRVLPFTAPYRALGGEATVALHGVQLSGGVEQMAPQFAGENAASWNRVGGALGFSAWRNRLTLRANWARLLPSDARLVPASVGGVDVGLDLSERFRLTMLYQQMFGGRGENTTSRVVSTGININF
jgi:hypothetical protein